MESMRDIKRRINSVKNTQKITKAMKMVAAAKLKKAQDKAEDARPFFRKTREIINDVYMFTKDSTEHPLMVEREGNKHLYIIINSDRGLCGSYNARVIEEAENSFSEDEENSLIVIGRNARDYFKKNNYDIVSEYIGIDDYPDYWFARRISDEIISLFKEEIVDHVSLVYTHFNSAISQTVKVIPLLPLKKISAGSLGINNSGSSDTYSSSGEVNNMNPAETGEISSSTNSTESNSAVENSSKQANEDNNSVEDMNLSGDNNEKKQVAYIYEPSPEQVFDILLPKYINNMLYSVMLESKASEFGARMTAMDSATDNAGDLIDDLTLLYNRARQAAITKEISEIVGGAEALK